MSTQTLIQYLDQSAYSALPSGGTAQVGTATMNKQQKEIFVAGSTVAVGDWVALDLTKITAVAPYDLDDASLASISIAPADLNVGAGAGITSKASMVIGVVLESAERDGALTAGSRVVVVTRGFAKAKVADNGGAGINIGQALVATNTGGVADIYGAGAVFPICGILAETIGSGAGTTSKLVYVNPFTT
jgi:hypothetical protein